jgi:hypothetical protein
VFGGAFGGAYRPTASGAAALSGPRGVMARRNVAAAASSDSRAAKLAGLDTPSCHSPTSHLTVHTSRVTCRQVSVTKTAEIELNSGGPSAPPLLTSTYTLIVGYVGMVLSVTKTAKVDPESGVHFLAQRTHFS